MDNIPKSSFAITITGFILLVWKNFHGLFSKSILFSRTSGSEKHTIFTDFMQKRHDFHRLFHVETRNANSIYTYNTSHLHQLSRFFFTMVEENFEIWWPECLQNTLISHFLDDLLHHGWRKFWNLMSWMPPEMLSTWSLAQFLMFL